MTHILVFNLALLGATLYAFWRGGSPERATAAVFLVAAVASFLLPHTGTRSIEPLLAAIDALTWFALTAIALKANRFWPMYQSALLLLTLAVHGVKIYQPGFPHWMYISTNGKLAYPTLILLAIGVVRHRQRLAQFGVDRPWSTSPAASTGGHRIPA